MQNTRIEKMSQVKSIVMASEVSNKSELIELIDKTIDGYKKKSVSKADKIRLDEIEQIKEAILEILSGVDRMRLGEITSAVNSAMDTEFSSNKISSVVTKLKAENRITRVEEKKIAYFSLH